MSCEKKKPITQNDDYYYFDYIETTSNDRHIIHMYFHY